ncbi:MAG TPA: glycine zipper family protein [Stellaceae bacterium]|nr:glycine zipper family protein [Stellaceae bacterium]
MRALKLPMASILWAALCTAAMAQQMYVYPARNQSPAQQDRDRSECSAWATQQTGFDPSMPPPQNPNYAPPPPGPFGSAAGGAALGAIGGAIGGNAGKGAAIGAGVGLLFGALRRAEYNQQQDYAAQQEAAAYANALAAFNRAQAACLTGRGYSVTY